LTYSLQI